MTINIIIIISIPFCIFILAQCLCITYVILVVCTDLSGKETHGQMNVNRLMTSGRLGGVMVSTHTNPECKICGFYSCSRHNIFHFHSHHDMHRKKVLVKMWWFFVCVSTILGQSSLSEGTITASQSRGHVGWNDSGCKSFRLPLPSVVCKSENRYYTLILAKRSRRQLLDFLYHLRLVNTECDRKTMCAL